MVGALQGVQLSQLRQQNCWAAAWLVHCKGVQLSQLHQQSCGAATWLVHSRGCSCPNCTNRVVGLLLGWCT